MTIPIKDANGATQTVNTPDEVKAAIVAAINAPTALPLPAGAATQATLAAVLAKLLAAPATEAKQDAIKTSVDALAPYLDGVEPLLTAIGTAIAGASYYPATQPVSGPLTDTQLRAAAIPISAAALPLPAGAATAAAVNATASADDIFTIAPSDTVALATVPKALLCTVAGNVAVRGTGAAPVTIPVVAGQVLPIRARYVYTSNTTATVVGLV